MTGTTRWRCKVLKNTSICSITLSIGLLAIASAAFSQTPPKYAAKVPDSITTPDTVETRIGTLRFLDGVPDEETVQRVYDQVDFGRGVEAFLSGVPAASVYGVCEGISQAGVTRNEVIGITEDLMDARSLFLTPNSTTVYVLMCLDLAAEPVVVQVPPNVLGPADDAYFRFITDLGRTGPDRGAGGKYLFLAPGYSGTVPEDDVFVIQSPTNSVLIFYRAFVEDDGIAGAVRSVKASARMYPLSAAASPPEQRFANISGLQFNTIHANDFRFYEELNAVVQSEPADFIDPETLGLFAAIGIKKGQPFEPDARMKKILTEAVAVGNAAARAIIFAPRDPRVPIYPDRQWGTGFVGGNYEFLDNGERMLDARTLFHYYATGITPAMAAAVPGSGSAYAIAVRDSKGRYFDGDKTYSITLPGPVPAAAFWSFTIYDNQTRSMLETDQKLAGIDSTLPDLKSNADGSVTVWFAPTAPQGHETNWVQTRPGKGWNSALRLYGPLDPWFDKSWKPGDFELVE